MICDTIKEMADSLQDGDVMLLENVRFRKEETENGAEFAKRIGFFG